MSIGIRGETRKESDYYSLGQFARRLACSPDTVRRHRIAGKFDELEWVDFFGNGRVRVSKASAEAFISKRVEATRQVYSQSVQKSRPS